MPPSPALSILASPKTPSIVTRKIAVLVADGVSISDVETVGKTLQAQGATVAVLASRLGHVSGSNGGMLAVDYTLKTMPSVLWDAVFVPSGAGSVKTLAASGDALLFIREQYKHAKPIAAFGDGVALLESADIHTTNASAALTLGVIVAQVNNTGVGVAAFSEAIAHGRFFNRTDMDAIPA